MITIKYHKKFLKEKRKLARKCPSIDKDFERFLQALKIDIQYNNFEVPINNKKYFKIAGLDESVYLPAFIAKVFYCEKMNKGNHSGLRITFIFDPCNHLLYFIQFYFKGKHEMEDKERINNLF